MSLLGIPVEYVVSFLGLLKIFSHILPIKGALYMRMTTPSGLYFHGTTKDLHYFLKNLSNYYTTISQLITQENLKKLHKTR